MPRHITNTSFNKGHPAWNRQELYINCLQCGKRVKTNNSKLRGGHRFCGKGCSYNYRSGHSVSGQIIQLFKEGKTAKEISQIVGRALSSVYWTLNTRKFRFRNGDLCTATKRRHFLEGRNCIICGFDRVVEAAHIIPACKNGATEGWNLLVLCPNHHKLFDRDLLDESEILKLEEYLDAECKPQATAIYGG